MVACAERHARVEVHDDLAGLRLVLAPRGTDDDSLADPKNVEELLPAILPLVLADTPLAELRQRCEVRDEAYADVYLGSPVVGGRIVGEVRLDDDTVRHRGTLALVGVEPSGLFDGDAALSVAVKDLGQRLNVFGRSLDAQLQPSGRACDSSGINRPSARP